MSSKEFVTAYYAEALKTQEKTGIAAIAILAQAAQESGWGRVAPGNMFFGVKDTDGLNGNEQLLTTHEYSRRADEKYKNIINVKPVMIKGQKFFEYKIQAYFRKYNTAEECFTDHANFILQHKNYAKALLVKNDVQKFIDELAAAGYATDPNYAGNLKKIAAMINKILVNP